MKKTTKSTTQKFIEVKDIRENIVLLEGGSACMMIRVTSTNFALLSKEEQDGKMYAYASLLNSLSFPIQILIKSKRIQILPYLKLLDQEAQKTSNPKLATFIRQYREFVENLVTVSTVLDKQFYIIISYSSFEKGVKNAVGSTTGIKLGSMDELYEQARSSLRTKAESLLSLIERLGLRGQIVTQEELVKLFYEIYNQGEGDLEINLSDMTKSAFVSKEKNV